MLDTGSNDFKFNGQLSYDNLKMNPRRFTVFSQNFYVEGGPKILNSENVHPSNAFNSDTLTLTVNGIS